MCCCLTALFQTEEAECYFWSSLNQKLWLFTKAAPQDIKTVFGNICDKKKKETNRKNELGSPCNWTERASCCSPYFFFLKPLLLHFSPFVGRNCTQSLQLLSKSQPRVNHPVWKRPFSPQYSLLLMLWKEIRDTQRINGGYSENSSLIQKNPERGLTIRQHPHGDDIRQLNKV